MAIRYREIPLCSIAVFVIRYIKINAASNVTRMEKCYDKGIRLGA